MKFKIPKKLLKVASENDVIMIYIYEIRIVISIIEVDNLRYLAMIK